MLSVRQNRMCLRIIWRMYVCSVRNDRIYGVRIPYDPYMYMVLENPTHAVFLCNWVAHAGSEQERGGRQNCSNLRQGISRMLLCPSRLFSLSDTGWQREHEQGGLQTAAVPLILCHSCPSVSIMLLCVPRTT